jgi:NAD(P)H-nitrite reductase large subunit
MRVVVVGSGLAGVTVAEALAKSARHAVTLVTTETHGYYSRPRLSHGFALSDEAAAKIVLKRFDALAPGVQVACGAEAVSIEREKRRLVLRNDQSLDYDILILAPGSAARIPPVLTASRPHFLTLNNLDDLLTLRRRHAKSRAGGRTPHWAVIGGGLIGCEFASDLRKAGDAVTLFHREPRLLELQLDPLQSQALHDHFMAQGIEVRYRQDVRGVFPGVVLTAEGEFGPYDGVIVSPGSRRARSSRGMQGWRLDAVSWSTSTCAPPIPPSTRWATPPRCRASFSPSSRRSAPRRYGWPSTSRAARRARGSRRPSSR